MAWKEFSAVLRQISTHGFYQVRELVGIAFRDKISAVGERMEGQGGVQ